MKKSLVIYHDGAALITISGFFPSSWLATDVLKQYAEKYGFEHGKLSYSITETLDIEEVMK